MARAAPGFLNSPGAPRLKLLARALQEPPPAQGMRWGHRMAGTFRTRAALAGAVACILLAAPAPGPWAAETNTADAKPADTPTDSARTESNGRARFGVVMDSVFGAGKWRETGGYRTPSRENELRAQGALTVPAGVLSRHSMGQPGAPGAYDLVVDGVSPALAAEKLRRAGAPFRLLAEGAHGTQGPHLHVEPSSADFKAGGSRPPGVEWLVKDATPAEQRVIALHARSEQGDADAQLRLGRLYAQGRDAPKDLIAAFVWTALAAANAQADAATRADAARLLAELAGTMRPQDLAQARRFASAPAAPVACGGLQDGGLVLVIGPDRPRPGTGSAEPQGSCARSTGD